MWWSPWICRTSCICKDTINIVLIVSVCKLLFAPFGAYISTDYEVHRWWLALTSTTPVHEWYTNADSLWTLDYPPLFAYAEWALSILIAAFEPGALDRLTENYDTPSFHLAHRAAVVLGDVALWAATCAYLAAVDCPTSRAPASVQRGLAWRNWITLGLVCTCPSLLLVDQLHFQFNAWLMAGLVFTLACARQQAWACMAASFAALVCSKHIFAALGPMVCVVLLVHALWQPIQQRQWRAGALQCVAVLGAVAGVLAAVLTPVLLSSPGHFTRSVAAIQARLFPWGRGLTHAYWAPNVWALYNAADLVATKLLAMAAPLVHRWPAVAELASYAQHAELPYARGLVQDFGSASHVVLPAPRPVHASLLTLLWMLPAMVAYMRRPTDSQRLYSMSWCFLGYFLWGWHVHEKALIYVTLPLLLAALESSHEWVVQVLFVAPITALAMLPLFTSAFELWLGLALTALWCVAWYQHGSLWLRLVRYPATKHSARDVDPLQVLSAAQSMACVLLWCTSGFYVVVMCIRALCPGLQRLGEFYPLLSMSTAGAACVALLTQWLSRKLY